MIPRYAREKMTAIWSPEAKFRIWFEIEAHAADAMAELGVIPRESAKNIWDKADFVKFDVARIDEIERVTKHDVIAFLTHLAEFIGPDSRFVHQGMTSSDVLDTCLAVFPRAAWDELATKVAALPTGNATAREFSRFLFGSAFELEIDAQGRLLLPATLREWSGLGGEAMVVGARDHAEIWTPERWDGYRGTMESSDALAAQLEGLGF